MKVRVIIHAVLRRYLPPDSQGNSATIDVPDGATVADLLSRLGIPEKHAAMFVSNDEHLERSSPITEGQSIEIFPPLAGGL